MAKLFFPSVIILACAFGFSLNAHELHVSPSSVDTYDLNDAAQYALAGEAAELVKEQSWYEWAKENATFLATFGVSAGRTLLSGIYGLVKDGVIALGTKYVADLLTATATALISVYLEFGATGTAVTGFLLNSLARKVVGIVRAKMAAVGAPLVDAAASRMEPIMYNILSTVLPVSK